MYATMLALGWFNWYAADYSNYASGCGGYDRDGPRGAFWSKVEKFVRPVQPERKPKCTPS